jgi:hypothetical protein
VGGSGGGPCPDGRGLLLVLVLVVVLVVARVRVVLVVPGYKRLGHGSGGAERQLLHHRHRVDDVPA